jgi:endonuclease/exonuclease/phosphatase family metal-dependent hydrolase
MHASGNLKPETHPMTAENRPPNASTPDAPLVRVLTWNIRKGIGWNGVYDLRRIVRLVSRHEPDIVALQEVDSRRAPDGDSPFSFLRQALGAHCVEARAISAPDGDYGHVVISRWPLSEPVLHDISVGRREPRRAIEAVVETEHGPLHLVAVHLGLAFSERRRQAHILADIVGAAPETSVLVGDFNDWVWRGWVNTRLSRELPVRTWHRTFPSFFPLARLDRIYCRPATALVRSWTDQRARSASDHLPVIAEIAMVR